jgi:hypothetical protein
MKRTLKCVTAACIAMSVAACADNTGPVIDPSLASAFNSVLLGFDNTSSSFSGGVEGGLSEWGPGGHHGDRRGPGHGSLMAGGLGGLFCGDGFGLGFGRGKFGGTLSGTCTFDAAQGRVVCDAQTRDDLTINRSAAFTTTSGQVQSAFDSLTTDKINTRVSVTGTKTRRDSSTTTVEHLSDFTVSGLAAGSTQRTINATSAGRESTSGTKRDTAYTAVRVMGDTINGVVIPVQSSNGHPIPTAGTVIRSMQVTLTLAGQTPTISTRREVVTYDGSNTAKVVIMQNGTTRNCTLPLPRGRLTCS